MTQDRARQRHDDFRDYSWMRRRAHDPPRSEASRMHDLQPWHGGRSDREASQKVGSRRWAEDRIRLLQEFLATRQPADVSDGGCDAPSATVCAR